MVLSEQQRAFIRYFGPSLAVGVVAWLAFLVIGQTPLLRASGLAAAVAGMAMTLRHMGGLMAVVGGLALAFSPAFWAQMGGVGATPATVVLALGAAGILAVGLVVLSQRPYVVMGAALVIFTGVFLSQIGEARSLRLSVFASAWLLYLLVRAVADANPRPEEPPSAVARHAAALRAGILLIVVVATINDSLFVLFVPAVVLGLMQSHARIPVWYWAIMIVVTAVGVWDMLHAYIDPAWWGVTVETALATAQDIPYLVADGFGDGGRWIATFGTLASQFSLFGLLLSVIGLARLSRWYPPVGTVMMFGYAAFFAFGLGYFGDDRTTRLLPLVMMQVFLMSYAIYAAGQWAAKAFSASERRVARLAAPLLFALVPAVLFLQIISA